MQPEYFSTVLDNLNKNRELNSSMISEMKDQNEEHSKEIDERKQAIEINNELIAVHNESYQKISKIIETYFYEAKTETPQILEPNHQPQ